MDRKSVVKRLLESYFENNDLISATFDVKSGLSLVSLRFDNTAILDQNSEPVTYVKKSRYHAVRDRERSELHKQSIRESKRHRKQTHFFDASTENPRFPDYENTDVSATGLVSPSSVCTDASSNSPHTSSLCMAESPDLPADHTAAAEISAATCKSSLFSGGTQNDFPSVHDVVQMESHVNISPQANISLPQIPDCLSDLSFQSHLREVDTDWPSIKCHDCMSDLIDCQNRDKNRRMTYCKNCGFYFCEQCNLDPTKLNENGKGNVCFCNETLRDIT